MMFWVVVGVMSLFAVALLLWPLLWQAPPSPPRDAYDLEVYRDQLAEIERDVERGVLGADLAESARAEIGRRALAADERVTAATETIAPTAPWRRWTFMAVAAVPALAAVLYSYGGVPGLIDPVQPVAEGPAAPSDAEIETLLARLAERLRQAPDDLEGWRLMARTLFSLRRFADSAAAFDKALALAPGDAELMARLGEALGFANGGTVTPRAVELFNAARKADPKGARARYYLGLAALQAGRRGEALEIWRALEAEAEPAAAWLPTLRPRIRRLAKELGVEPSAPGPAASGPTKDDVAAARDMSADDRQAMIRTMVARLESRLEKEPDDADGWLRLGRSWRVLDEAEKSRDAYARAAKLRPDDTGVLVAYADSLFWATTSGAKLPDALGRTIARILELEPNNRNGLWLAGLAAQGAGDTAETGRYWRKLLALLTAGSPEHEQLSRRIKALDEK